MTCAQGLLRLLWGGGPKLECYETAPTEMQGEVYRLARTYRGANRLRFGLRLGLEPLPEP